MSKLPINLDDLLRQRRVEGDRIEYKAGWNPDAIIRTLCAFANDFENLGGGYIVIGQDCDEAGRPVFPPVGLHQDQLDRIQRDLLARCSLIQPPYFPMLSVESFEGRKLIVLWAPGGQGRPYKAPRAVTAKHKDHRYYIRRYASTVEAKGDDERELISLTATVPFDDRRCMTAGLTDLRLPLIRGYLGEVGSGLYEDAATLPALELARRLNLVDGADERVHPRNVGLLFFHEAPERFLPGAQIDLVTFPKGAGGGEIVEQTLRGPLHQQIRDALREIQNNVLRTHLTKSAAVAPAQQTVNYPFAAIEEVLVNAVYHRSYELPEPIEVRINPDCIEVLSYPGPDASIRPAALNTGKVVARRYRNRRIGEFLKELRLTEGRSTGIPTIRRALAENGSPPARFSTDEGRTYFLVEIPIHPSFVPRPTEDTGTRSGPGRDQVEILRECVTDASIVDLMAVAGRTNRTKFRDQVLRPLLDAGLIEMTVPDKPTSSKQRYRLTQAGLAALANEKTP
jgi:ATP-dependent DNA helicase RecG